MNSARGRGVCTTPASSLRPRRQFGFVRGTGPQPQWAVYPYAMQAKRAAAPRAVRRSALHHPQENSVTPFQRLVVLASVASALACADREPPEFIEPSVTGAERPRPETLAASSAQPSADPSARLPAFYVQAGAFADSSQARALLDSMTAQGWEGALARVTSDSLPPWRVGLEPSQSQNVAIVLMAGLRAQGIQAAIARDSSVVVSRAVELHPTLVGDQGRFRRSRWALSPDRNTMVVVDDPSAIENEPLADGLVVASETGRYLVREDSVWDVAVSPDWKRIAFGKAYLVTSTSRDSLTASEWFRIGYYTQFPATVVRRHAFQASTMNISYAFAQPVVVELDSVAASRGGRFGSAARRLAYPGGWRVRWIRNGEMLGVGSGPSTVRDDAAPRRWLVVDPRNGLARGELARSAVPASGAAWTNGPVLDVSVPLDRSARSFQIAGGTVESGGGWIRIRGRAAGERGMRVVGPGMALATTRTGRYILALVPDPQAEENEVPYRLAVYELRD